MLITTKVNVLTILLNEKTNKIKEKNRNDNNKNFRRNIKRESKSLSVQLIHQYCSLINLILLKLILILLPKRILLIDPYIELKVNSIGYHQILSDRYTGIKPSLIFVNEEFRIMKDLKIYVDSPDYTIQLEWENTLTDFTYMFYNLTSIISVKMNNISGNGCNMSYMFYNCNNLQDFEYISNYDHSHVVKDTIGMFYNCILLKTFSFDNFYMGCLNNCNSISEQYFRNMSYMFYNCQNLESISSTKEIIYINDMRNMFYNCYSLISFDINNFRSLSNNEDINNQYVDVSYMFYNCSSLSDFIFPNNDFYVKDMNNMFYNCSSLKSINLNSFKSNSDLPINMSQLFYNCQQLERIDGNYKNFYFSDAREMFFNCVSLKDIITNNISQDTEIYIIHNNNINMSKMFYNCHSLKKISICNDNNTYISPNDLNAMFYNCCSLEYVSFQYINVNNIQNMSYMFYNCKNMKSFIRSSFSYNEDLMIKNRTMKGMFQNCESLYSLDLKNDFHTKNVEIMWNMFNGCRNLEILDLSNFDTSQVTDMESMFEGCYNLISLNLNSFNTSKVKYMDRMFYECSNLKSLLFHSISSNSLGTMQQMFYKCSNLEYLDLYSLTEKAQSIVEMFTEASTNFTFCIKENEDIPNIFDQWLNKDGITRDCSDKCYGKKRVSIPEKKLCCRNVEYNGSCYDSCPGRTRVECNDENQDNYKKCQNFNCSNPYEYYNYIQSGCTSDIIGYFINDTDLGTIDKCHDDCLTCSEGPKDDKNTNCESCKDSKHLYLGNCYDKCLRGSYKDKNNNDICYCFNETCLKCNEQQAKEGKCSECNNKDSYYKKESDKSDSFYCYKNLEKHYLKYKQYYPCFNSCLKCNKEGNSDNHLCNVCDFNYSLALKKGEYYNCYHKCPYYFYFNRSKKNEYTCTDNSICPKKYVKFVPDIKQCVEKCEHTDYYKYEFNKKCYPKCPIDTKEEENKKYSCYLNCPFERPFRLVGEEFCVSTCTINERRDLKCVTNYFGNRTNEEIQDKILADIEDHLIMDTFNYTNINDEEYIINETKTFYELTTTKKGPSKSGISYLDLGECEKALREFYNLKNTDDPLYILKFDMDIEGKEGPTVDYRVYYPLDDGKTLDPLDLTICEGKEVYISFPINLTGDPAIYNKNSPYYNDLCVPYDTNDGVDITLEDRQNKYTEFNKSLCEENCIFVGYNSTTKRAKCSCDVKFTLRLISEIKIDKNKLYKFMDIKKIANFDVLKCYKLITSKVGILTNIGFYLLLPTFIMYFVTFFIFYIKEFDLLKKIINDIAYAKKFEKYLEKYNKSKSKPLKKDFRFVRPAIFNVFSYKKRQLKRKSGINLSRNNIQENVKMNDLIAQNNIKNKIKQKINKSISIVRNSKEILIKNQSTIKKDKINFPPIKKLNEKFTQQENSLEKSKFNSSINNLKSNKIVSQLNTNSKNMTNIFDDLSEQEKEKIKLTLEYNDSELNGLNYKEALKYDDRNYFQYYWALLRTNHIVIKIFSKTDYNSRIIKIFLCFFIFSLDFTINTLFFSDETMHKILEDEGKFNLIYQLPQIIYSTVISKIFDSIFSFLSLSEEDILSLKHEKVFRNVQRRAKEVIRALQIKFVNFFILSFVFFMGFWYYVSCFCAVYKNTQYHLIKDSLISFGTSLLSPLGLYLIPGLFRIPGIKNRKKFLYLMSNIIQLCFI